MSDPSWSERAESLKSLLTLDVPPLAITFSDERPEGIARFDEPMAAPAEDGRTGMPAGQLTCAIPGRRLGEIVDLLKSTCGVDGAVAAYAAADARRFDGARR